MEKKDVYATVTNMIIAAIEAGVGNWQMPWHTSGSFSESPINFLSRKPYRGVNILCLWASAQAKGYTSGEWGTYKQWSEAGAQVRKGEKSTAIVFWGFKDGKKESEDGSESEAGFAYAKVYAVFNAAQVDGYVPRVETVPTVVERIEKADRWFSNIGADVRHGGNRAYYNPNADYIQMPQIEAFNETVAYYGTLAHELTHWTGKESRADRKLEKRFGTEAYAAEELIAELGASFVCSHLGLETEPREDHAKYLVHWLKVLKADKRAIFTAASQAQKATDYLIAQAERSEVKAA
ncbi:unnamed protein product [Sphagnum tenellum]